ncbi:unnamed protein product [Sphagnum troendelagicum]
MSGGCMNLACVQASTEVTSCCFFSVAAMFMQFGLAAAEGDHGFCHQGGALLSFRNHNDLRSRASSSHDSHLSSVKGVKKVLLQ